MKKSLVVALAAVVLVAGAGLAYVRFMAPADDAALRFVPKDAVLYGTLFIRPSSDQKMALDDLLQKFPNIENTDDAIDKLMELLDEELGKEGLAYEEDIEPWLGDQVGGFMMPGGSVEIPNVGVIVESKDDDALRDFISRIQEEDAPDAVIVEREHNGSTYEVVEEEPGAPSFVFLDGFFVGGTEEAVKAAIDADAGESLQDSEKFTNASEDLRDDWLGLFYADTAAMFEMFDAGVPASGPEQAVFDSFGLKDQLPSAGVAYVTSDTIGFESSGGVPTEGPLAGMTTFVGSGLLPDLPSESWAAFGIPDVGRLSQKVFELFEDFPGFDRDQIESQFRAETGLDLQHDLLSWMGDAGIFVQGRNMQEIGGGLVLESTDPAKTSAVFETLQDLLAEQGAQPRHATVGELDGFSVQAPGMPAPVYFLAGERAVVAYGQTAAEQAIAPEQRLADAETFGMGADELGDDFDVALYVDVDAAQSFAESLMSFSGETDPTYEEDIKPYVDPFGYVIAGSRTDGENIVQRLVIGVP